MPNNTHADVRAAHAMLGQLDREAAEAAVLLRSGGIDDCSGSPEELGNDDMDSLLTGYGGSGGGGHADGYGVLDDFGDGNESPPEL